MSLTAMCLLESASRKFFMISTHIMSRRYDSNVFALRRPEAQEAKIAPSLTVLFNKSLRTGVLPRDWKLANVVPVHKKENKEQVENYRPIYNHFFR